LKSVEQRVTAAFIATADRVSLYCHPMRQCAPAQASGTQYGHCWQCMACAELLLIDTASNAPPPPSLNAAGDAMVLLVGVLRGWVGCGRGEADERDKLFLLQYVGKKRGESVLRVSRVSQCVPRIITAAVQVLI
jgi:hypothetical protein